MNEMKQFIKNEYFIAFSIGFLAGLIPTLIFLLLIAPVLFFWSFLVGVVFGIIAIITLYVYKKFKIAGIMLLILLILSYLIFIYLLWDLRNGYFGGFIG